MRGFGLLCVIHLPIQCITSRSRLAFDDLCKRRQAGMLVDVEQGKSRSCSTLAAAAMKVKVAAGGEGFEQLD